MSHPCLKQTTRCVVLRGRRRYEATNTCDIGPDAAECPRVAAGCASGEGYELCNSTHAEANVAALAAETTDEGEGVALLYGHDWFCGPCQHALAAVGVHDFVLTGEPA